MATSSVNGNETVNSNRNVNGKRTFKNIRKEILLCLSKGQMTVNEIAVCAKINWKTVSNHLIHLTGRGLVKEVLNSAYARIYELTEEGKNFLMITVSDTIIIGNNEKIKIFSSIKSIPHFLYNKKNAPIKTTSIILL